MLDCMHLPLSLIPRSCLSSGTHFHFAKTGVLPISVAPVGTALENCHAFDSKKKVSS